MMERFSSLVTKSRPWPVIGRTIFFTSDKNRPTRDEIYFIDFWRENLSMYRINSNTRTMLWTLLSLLCVKYIFVWFYQSFGFKGNITLNHAIVMFIHALQRM